MWIYLYIPETKGVPLEEIAALFGDPNEVAIFSKNIQLNRETHELIINKHDNVTAGVTGEAVAKAGESEKI